MISTPVRGAGDRLDWPAVRPPGDRGAILIVLTIRQLVPSDVAFAMRMVEIAGWNQVSSDWERLMRVGPGGCFLAEWLGEPAGTATATQYGLDCAWIGMVLVDPGYQRRGIGMGSIGHCIEYLRSLGVRTIKLDATDQGRPVYLKQGFMDECPTLRHVGELKASDVPRGSCTIERWSERYEAAVRLLDRQAFAADRSPLVSVLAEQQPDLALVAVDGREVVGYGLARPGRLYGYLGPIIAKRMSVAQRLALELAGRLSQRTVLLDTTALDERWCEWLQGSGLTVQRRLTRMYLGTNDASGDPRRVYGLSGLETG